MRIQLRAPDAEHTRAVGAALAELLRSGDAVALTGELGAGKTTLVQGVAHGLGIDEPVVSPTFTLVREYPGQLPVIHVDVYRLDRVQDVLDLGLEELPDGVLLVEWGDAVEALLPEERLRIELTAPDPDSEARRIVVTGNGRAWAERWERLEQRLQAWAVASQSSPSSRSSGDPSDGGERS
jgi:tRNA threonylcarbamoyladenosine biosynthesis protein TsaE